MKKIVLILTILISSVFANEITINEFLNPIHLKNEWLDYEYNNKNTCDNSLAAFQQREAIIKGKTQAFNYMNGSMSKGMIIGNYAGGTSFSISYDTYLWNFYKLICSLSKEEFQNMAVIMYFRVMKKDWKDNDIKFESEMVKMKVREKTMLHFLKFKMNPKTFFNFYVKAYHSISGEPYSESDKFARAVFQGNIIKAINLLHSPKIERYLDYLYQQGTLHEGGNHINRLKALLNKIKREQGGR